MQGGCIAFIVGSNGCVVTFIVDSEITEVDVVDMFIIIVGKEIGENS